MRYLPLTKEARSQMLAAAGVSSVDEFYKSVPKEAFIKGLANLPMHQGEIEVERDVAKMAAKNLSAASNPFFLGAGCYYHHIPATVDHLIQRSEFLTAYTPYQPEISQGTLTVIYEFQTMICMLTGQEVANASMYDGATATAEAALMALRINKKRKNIHILGRLNPKYKDVVETYLRNYEEITIKSSEPDENAACVIVQIPDFYGETQQLEALRKKCDETGALLVVVVTEILSLGLLPAPSVADIVVGEAQSIGIPMSFGGPHLGFFASKMQYIRQMPGRICGETVDADGRRSFVLTLNTREQHIRREKATSNICTNQGLCATAFTIHMSLLGEDGFMKLAKINHEKACILADKLAKISGVKIVNKSFFNEFTIEIDGDSKELATSLAKQGIIAGLPVDGNKMIIAVTEMVTDEDMDKFVQAINKI